MSSVERCLLTVACRNLLDGLTQPRIIAIESIPAVGTADRRARLEACTRGGQPSCDDGASEIRIGTTFPNRC